MLTSSNIGESTREAPTTNRSLHNEFTLMCFATSEIASSFMQGPRLQSGARHTASALIAVRRQASDESQLLRRRQRPEARTINMDSRCVQDHSNYASNFARWNRNINNHMAELADLETRHWHCSSRKMCDLGCVREHSNHAFNSTRWNRKITYYMDELVVLENRH